LNFAGDDILSGTEKGWIDHPKSGDWKSDFSQMENFLTFLRSHLTERYQKNTWTEGSVRALLQRLQPTRFEMDALFGLARSLSKSSARKEKNEPISF
jgi:tRNA C32,U32 (ribose-2'-O)-methylase TrmJ